MEKPAVRTSSSLAAGRARRTFSATVEPTIYLLAFGFGSLGLERISLIVRAGNARAIRSYEKVGFQREGIMRRAFRVDGLLEDALLMAILRDEWVAPTAGAP